MQYKTFSFLSPVTFIIAFAGFFLTFTEVNCNGQQLDTIKGIELVTGYEQDLNIVNNDATENKAEKKAERYDPNIFALNAFIAAIIGLILMAVKKLRTNYKLVSIIATIGFICLIAMMVDLKSKIADAQNDSGSKLNIDLNIDFKMKFGYWLVTASFFVAALWNAMMGFGNRKTVAEVTFEPDEHLPTEPS